MHGIDGTCKDFEHVIPWLQKSHPGTLTYCIPKFEGTPMSWIALPLQIPSIIKNITNYIAQNPADFEDGYHLVCHSQGGLICRAITEMMDDHKIHTLVSLAGPQLGVWGKDFFNGIRIPIFENLTRDQIYRLAYLPEAQATLSVANMWNDPAHFSLYEEKNTFLPYINGEKEDAQRLKANFLKLQKAVFLVGSFNDTGYDGGIEPWQSGVWGYVDGSGKEVQMEHLSIFVNDTFGLRTLNETGRLKVQRVSRAGHDSWVEDETTFNTYILPHLI